MPYQPGDTILNKYLIEKTLGAGAFGEVYLVTHKLLRVPRAVKVLRREFSGLSNGEYGQIQARFMLEAQLGAQIHAHLLLVHDCHISDELCLLEMEYAAGGSLTMRLQAARAGGQPLAVEQALRIAAEVAEGLAALHALDIVHRDLKPSNILFDEHGQARVADLGLAQAPGGPSNRSQNSAGTARLHPGTPGYMSPEQVSSRGLLTPPSDIYSLGLVLFEMLTGRNYSLQRPGTRAASLRKEVSAPLDDLLARMLAENYRERPWDGAEAAGLLREVLQEVGSGQAQAREEARLRKEKEAEDERQRQAEELRKKQAADELARQQIEAARLRKEKQAEDERLRQAEELRKKLAVEEQARKLAEEKKRTELLIELAPGVTMQFARVPAGEFLMGSDPKKDNRAYPDEQPQHKVSLPEYLIGKTPVTNVQYAAFAQATGVKKPAHWANGEIPKDKREHPVVNVSWKDAVAFCAWLSQVSGRQVRLPSEAEWEKAARGADGRIYPWGNQAPDAQRCNFNNNVKDTTPAGRYSPQGDSPYGCADMAGNVWEWTRTIWDDKFKYPYKTDDGREDLRQENATRTLRGGAFYYDEDHARCAYRFWLYPDLGLGGRGFRVVVSPILLS